MEQPFNIRLVEALSTGQIPVVKETSAEWVLTCPICGDTNLKVSKSKKTLGAYQCWSTGCRPVDIRNSLFPKDPTKVSQKLRGRPSTEDRKEKALKELAGVILASEFSDPLKVGFFGKDTFLPSEPRTASFFDHSNKWVKETIYVSDDEEFAVRRVEWKDSSSKKGRDKRIRRIRFLTPGDPRSRWEACSSEEDEFSSSGMMPYGLKEAISLCEITNTNVIFGFEGSHKADMARHILNIPAIGFESWDLDDDGCIPSARETAKVFLEKKLVLVYLRDWDKAGLAKRDRIERSYLMEGGSIMALGESSLSELYPDSRNNSGQDIVDTLKEVVDLTNYRLKKGTSDEAKAVSEVRDFIVEAATTSTPMTERLAEVAARLREEVRTTTESVAARKRDSKYSSADVAHTIRDQYATQIAWNSSQKRWYSYRHGVWKPVSEETLRREFIMPAIDEMGITLTTSFVNNVHQMLKDVLEMTERHSEGHLIPFRNGVLNTKTNQFTKHSCNHWLFWQLPFDYEPVRNLERQLLIDRCKPIWDWLIESVGGELPGNDEIAHLLCAYIGAVIRRKTDLQRFLACIGPAGSGKGTFLRLATAMVGLENTTSITLGELETSRFAMDRAANATLVAVGEVESFLGSCPNLKSLVGQDAVAPEKKGVQLEAGQSQYAKGMIIMAGERIPTAADTGGLHRRMLIVPFMPVKESKRKNLLSLGDEVTGEFAPYLAAFFSLCMSYSDKEIRQYVLETHSYVPRLAEIKAVSLLQNPIISWLEECCYYDPRREPDGAFPLGTQIGVKRLGESREILHVNDWLYASFTAYCESNGRKGMASNTFSTELITLVNTQLGLPISIYRKSGKAYISAIRIRDESSDYDMGKPRIISETYTQSLIQRAQAQREDTVIQSKPEEDQERVQEQKQAQEEEQTELHRIAQLLDIQISSDEFVPDPEVEQLNCQKLIKSIQLDDFPGLQCPLEECIYLTWQDNIWLLAFYSPPSEGAFVAYLLSATTVDEKLAYTRIEAETLLQIQVLKVCRRT